MRTDPPWSSHWPDSKEAPGTWLEKWHCSGLGLAIWPARQQRGACEVCYPPGPGTVTDWTSKHRSVSGPQLHSSGGWGQEDRLWCDQKPQSCNGRERPLAWSLRTQPRGQPATTAPGGLLLEPGLGLSVRGTMRCQRLPRCRRSSPRCLRGPVAEPEQALAWCGGGVRHRLIITPALVGGSN